MQCCSTRYALPETCLHTADKQRQPQQQQHEVLIVIYQAKKMTNIKQRGDSVLAYHIATKFTLHAP